MTCRATWRSSTRSWARQNRPPPLSVRRSTRRYRSASTSPGRIELGTQLPSSVTRDIDPRWPWGHRRATSVSTGEGKPSGDRVDDRGELREPHHARRPDQHEGAGGPGDDDGRGRRPPARAAEQLVEEVRRT